jgi:hypothetical protein
LTGSLGSGLGSSFFLHLLQKGEFARGAAFLFIQNAVAVFVELLDEFLALIFQKFQIGFAFGGIELAILIGV